MRFWVESVATCLTAVLFVLTLISKEWIEILFRVDPDEGSGALEIALLILCAGVACVSGMLAHRDWRRAAVAHSA
jgi:hypothetical protein